MTLLACFIVIAAAFAAGWRMADNVTAMTDGEDDVSYLP